MTKAAAASSGNVHFYCSSGGNAGLACATSAIALRRPATIVIPTNISSFMKGKLLDLGVEVHQVGKNWAAADKYLREELLAKDPDGVYVPPFDHPLIWEGAASLVEELREQMEVPMAGIVASVGGGGLVNGLMKGVEGNSWSTKPMVLAVETEGADSLNASVRAGSHVALPEITSIATSLGASRVSEQTWKWSQESDSLKSIVVSDADAAASCVRFADDARMLIEVSCGATIAVAYRGDLRRHLGSGMSDEEWARQNVVLVVCGGSGVSLDILANYRETYGPQASFKI